MGVIIEKCVHNWHSSWSLHYEEVTNVLMLFWPGKGLLQAGIVQ